MSLVIPLGELPPTAFQLGPEIADPQPRMYADAALFRYIDSLTTDIMAEAEVLAVNQGLIEADDNFTLMHQRRVGMLAGAIAVARGDSAEQVSACIRGGVTHDNGKCNCQSVVHSTQAELAPELQGPKEMHTISGAVRVETYMGRDEIIAVALGHHEFRADAQYPDVNAPYLTDRQQALLVDDVLMGAKGIVQVVAVADAFDAITSRRPYKKPKTPIEAYMGLKEEFTGDHNLIDTVAYGVYGLPLVALEQIRAS